MSIACQSKNKSNSWYLADQFEAMFLHGINNALDMKCDKHSNVFSVLCFPNVLSYL